MHLRPNFETVGKAIKGEAILLYTNSKGETVQEQGEKRQIERELPWNDKSSQISGRERGRIAICRTQDSWLSSGF